MVHRQRVQIRYEIYGNIFIKIQCFQILKNKKRNEQRTSMHIPIKATFAKSQRDESVIFLYLFIHFIIDISNLKICDDITGITGKSHEILRCEPAYFKLISYFCENYYR